MLYPGQTIELSERDKDLLGSEMSLFIDDLENTYHPLFEAIRIWWAWYDATPNEKVKNWPWRNASNLVVPLIAIMSDSLVARLYGSIFGGGNRIWSTFTENEQMESVAKNVGRHMNWAARNDFNIKLPVYDWLSEMVPIGSSVLAGGWREDVRDVFFRQGKGGQRRIVSQRVSFGRGPYFEQVPREQILWDTNHLISDAPFVCREFHYMWTQIRDLAKTNPGWDLEAVENLKGRGGVHSPSRKTDRQKKEADQRQTGDRELIEPHDLREVWADWPILRSMGFDKAETWRPNQEDVETPSIPLVATLHRETRQLLQLKAAPYFWPGKPFFDGFIRKRSGRGHAVGLAKRLEHPQLALTTILNQSIDNRTRANSLWSVTTNRQLLSEPIDPSHPLYVTSMESFRELNLSSNNFQDLSLMQAVQTIAERLTGQSDPNFGQNTRQGGHPAPATSTLALLQQGDQMSLPTRELLRIQLSRVGQFAATLYQQFEMDEDGRLRRIFGDRDAADLQEWLFPTEPIVGNIEFDVASMSQLHSPQAEMNRAIQVTQMNTNYWAFVLRALQVIQQGANNPLLVQMATKSISAQTEAHMKFLEASDVDDIEKFVAQLNQGLEGDTQRLQRVVGELRDLAGASGAVPEPSLGNAPLPLPSGALQPAGALGGFG